MKRIATLAAVMLAGSLLLGADDAPKIRSYNAKAAIEKRDAAANQAYQDYLSKLVVADKQLSISLEQALREAMLNKDLDEAKAIDTLKKQVDQRLLAAQGGDPTPRISGTQWKLSENTVVTFAAGGKMFANTWTVPGRWQVIDSNSVLVTQPDDKLVQVTFAHDMVHLLWVAYAPGRDTRHEIATVYGTITSGSN